MKSTDKSRIRRAILNTEKAETEGSWNYYGRQPLVIQTDKLGIHLEFYRDMSDPVALFRPQTLSSFHGIALVEKSRAYEVLVIIGTDEGLLSGWAPILIGNKKSISQFVKRKQFQQIRNIIPLRYIGG